VEITYQERKDSCRIYKCYNSYHYLELDFLMTKKSTVNKAGNYTKPTMRKKIFQRIKSQASHGTAAGQWSARKAQALAKAYKKAGGGYK
jgi:hypothetical protein